MNGDTKIRKAQDASDLHMLKDDGPPAQKPGQGHISKELREAIDYLLAEGKIVRGVDGRLRAREFAGGGYKH
jgi:hypothetical protein